MERLKRTRLEAIGVVRGDLAAIATVYVPNAALLAILLGWRWLFDTDTEPSSWDRVQVVVGLLLLANVLFYYGKLERGYFVAAMSMWLVAILLRHASYAASALPQWVCLAFAGVALLLAGLARHFWRPPHVGWTTIMLRLEMVRLSGYLVLQVGFHLLEQPHFRNWWWWPLFTLLITWPAVANRKWPGFTTHMPDGNPLPGGRSLVGYGRFFSGLATFKTIIYMVDAVAGTARAYPLMSSNAVLAAPVLTVVLWSLFWHKEPPKRDARNAELLATFAAGAATALRLSLVSRPAVPMVLWGVFCFAFVTSFVIVKRSRKNLVG